MRYRRQDIVARAIELLDRDGLEALTMRRLAGDLGVQPSALYHHFAGKDPLLAAVADEVLARGRRGTEIVTWEAELRLACVELRDAMLAHRDGAALVARVHALGLGATEPGERMRGALTRAGADDHLARIGARTLVHFVLGHVVDEQTAVAGDRPGPRTEGEDFHVGLSLLLEGLRQRVAVAVG